MNILIDMSSIRAGGGVQQAINFIENIEKTSFYEHRLYLLIPSQGALRKLARIPRVTYIYSPVNYLARFIYGFYLSRFMINHRIDLIFTFFGPGLLHNKEVFSAVSVAYPIICYPNSPFWRNLPLLSRAQNKLINYFRVVRIRKADVIISETEVMKDRLARILRIGKKKFIVSPPVVSHYLTNASFEFGRQKEDHNRFLVLGGVSIHKNIWRLYDLCTYIEKESRKLNIVFYLSITKSDYIGLLNKLRYRFDPNILDKYFVFCGPIEPTRISEVYSKCDYLINLSDLESFSNNYVEAWKAGLPLLASDRDFSRNVCGSAAIYFEPHSVDSLYNAVCQAVFNKELCHKVVEAGKERLVLLPSLETKFNNLLDSLIVRLHSEG